MNSEEEMHQLIHTNLSLLVKKGHKIDFEQHMFRGINVSGFENVGYALLRVLDPEECKKSIPWPILDDRRRRFQFQRNFVKFVKSINKLYPLASIPEVPASSLQAPGGSTFLNFMYKLSSFALELELTRILSPEEAEELLPRFLPSKQHKDQKVKIAIVTGALHEVERAQLEREDYHFTALPVLEKLNDINNTLTNNIERVAAKLKEEVSGLDLDDQTKQHMLNIEDSDVMKDYNQRTNKKKRALSSSSQKLIQYRDMTNQICQLLKTVAESHTQPLCLDGAVLNITPVIAELAGRCPVYNNHKEVRLEAVLRAGLAAAQRLSPANPNQTPLLAEAQSMLVETCELKKGAMEVNVSLDNIFSKSQKIVEELQPIVYAQKREKKAPDFFKYLQEQPPLQFILPSSLMKTSVPHIQVKTKRLHDILKRKRTLTCSTNLRQTPVHTFRQPRASTTNTLRTKKRRSISVPDVTRELFQSSTPQVAKTLSPELGLSCQPSDEENLKNVAETLQVVNRRDSIDKVIARYRNIKRSMMESAGNPS